MAPGQCIARNRWIRQSPWRLARSSGCEGISAGTNRGSDHHHRFCPYQRFDHRWHRHRHVSSPNPTSQPGDAMVVSRINICPGRSGSLLVELLVAMAILSAVILPLAYSIAGERRFARAVYQRAVAVEIVDGEMEALAAGGWQAFSNGVVDYTVHVRAATNLPPGRFTLTMTPQKLVLEWRPSVKQHGGSVVREVNRR